MARSAQVEEILAIMKRKDHIRNIGIVAHIDHGKTTLTDLLLAEAGLIPRSLAGEILMLDYLEEERKRGITIKAGNISLLHKLDGEKYVVNLVDTPGHVDFTGRVARALRVVDGAIVLVDAVEEIMAQTEVVTRQILDERIKPILLINKVDRLITELKLTVDQIHAKVARIIQGFNNLIDMYCEPPFRDKWKIDVSRGNVILGSALHKWGLTAELAKRKRIKFSDIIEAYSSGEWQSLQEIIPLHKAVLEAIVRNLPSPVEAQKYRVPKIWGGKLDSEIGRAMIECDPHGPTAICVVNVKSDPTEGLVATGRIFSGSIEEGDRVYLVNAGEECVVNKLSIYMGAFREHVHRLESGSIGALSGFKMVRVGETIVDVEHKHNMVPFEEIKYISEPVVTISIEPKDPRDLPRLMRVLESLLIEDPHLSLSVNEETGEYLLSGVGELHLDISIKAIKEKAPDLEIVVSKPIISYRESIEKTGIVATVLSPNELNSISINVEPIRENLLGATSIRACLKDAEISSRTVKNAELIIEVEENENILVDLSGYHYSEEDLNAIISGFRWACKSGPLCGEPLKGVRVNLVDVHLAQEKEDRGYAQITPTVRKAIFKSFMTASPILLEPVYAIQISAPAEQVGVLVNLLAKRRGKILNVSQRGPLLVINGLIPIAESLGLADELRSASSGRAFWQSRFSHWEKVPREYMSGIVESIRMRRGLSRDLFKQ
ncbi:MAG: GTP-binding protein [Candidatus Bathyarchaeia archaeon]